MVSMYQCPLRATKSPYPISMCNHWRNLLGWDSDFTLGILGILVNYTSVGGKVPPMVRLPLFAATVAYE